MEFKQDTSLVPGLAQTVDELTKQFQIISPERRQLLSQLTDLIQEKYNAGEEINLNFICTHNSRRSHIAQLWAKAAAHYYSISGVAAFSGGTEATAFNPRAVKALRKAGFEIIKTSETDNPVYEVTFSNEVPPIKALSKKYNDPFNPQKNFAAIMTCSQADENCPLVLGASERIAITYDDPKDFDDTDQEENKYNERVLEIGREILYAFSTVKKN